MGMQNGADMNMQNGADMDMQNGAEMTNTKWNRNGIQSGT